MTMCKIAAAAACAALLVVQGLMADVRLPALIGDHMLVQRDMPALQAAVLVFGGTVLLVNLIVDVLYTLANPTIRYGA